MRGSGESNKCFCRKRTKPVYSIIDIGIENQ